MPLRKFWKKIRPQEMHRVPFLENSVMREAFAAREPGAIDFKNWKLGVAAALLALGLTGCVAYPTGQRDTYYYEPTYAPAYVAPSVGVYYSSGDRHYYRDGRHYRGGHYHRRGRY